MRQSNIIDFESPGQHELSQEAGVEGPMPRTASRFWYLDSPVMVSGVLKHVVWSYGMEVVWSPISLLLQHFGDSCWNHRIWVPEVSIFECLWGRRCSERVPNISAS